jgi:hypothetical protein
MVGVVYTLLAFFFLIKYIYHIFDMCYPVHFCSLNNFIANKCTSFILFSYVTYNLADMFRSVRIIVWASFT